ncbi:MAG: DUF447 domain-containing protein [Aureliella sp.]
MIIEGLLTTTASDGTPHVAPMGPVVDEDLRTWTLRPFASSTTFRCLQANPHCVFHIVDDVLPVVQAALGLPTSLSFEPLAGTTERDSLKYSDGNAIDRAWTITAACHWYHLQVTEWDTSQPRSVAKTRLIEQRIQRPFWGWNRAKHAILEATILASRIHLLPREAIDAELIKYETAIHKTAGERERLAWQLLKDFFEVNA